MDYSKYINYMFYSIPSHFALEHLIVCDIAGYTAEKNFFYDRETFDDNLILFVLKGTFYLEQYGVKYTLKSGQGIMIKLTDHHKYYTDPVDIAHFIFFHFKGHPIEPIMNTLSHHNYLPIIFQNDPYVKESIYHCFELTENQKKHFEYELSAHIYQTVLHIATPYLYKIDCSDIKENFWFTDEIQRYVSDHIYEKISLEQLSAAVHMNKFHFCRKFNQVYHTSPMQYVISQKLHLGLKLLDNSDQSINEIAHALAFSDLAHFSRSFKKIFGISPSSYRKHCGSSIKGQQEEENGKSEP